MTSAAFELSNRADVPCIPRDEFVARARGRQVRVIECAARDMLGSLFNATAYMVVATVILMLVIDWDWNIRFLIAVAFFHAIAAMCLLDVFAANRVAYYRVETVDAGDRLAFATPSLDEASAVAAIVWT